MHKWELVTSLIGLTCHSVSVFFNSTKYSLPTKKSRVPSICITSVFLCMLVLCWPIKARHATV